MPQQTKYWMFTYNMVEQLEDDYVPEEDLQDYQYLCYQFEIGDSGNPHYQGYVAFQKKKRFNELKNKYSDKYHWEARRGTHQQAKNYCQKTDTAVPGTFEEFGSDEDIPDGSGQRNDLEDVKKAIKSGKTLKQIRDEYPNVYSRCRTWVHEYFNDYLDEKRMKDLKESLEDAPTITWHSEAEQRLMNQDKRKILWIIGKQGEEGKTLFAKNLLLNYGERVYATSALKSSDIIYEWKETQDIVVFNLTATTNEFIPYHLFEQFKDGIITSTKYQTQTKMNFKVKLCILSNYQPDTSKLKKNRFDIMNLQ